MNLTKRSITLIAMILAFHHGLSQSNLDSAITITVKLNKSFVSKDAKINYHREIEENYSVVNSDSVKQRHFIVNIEIKNISNRSINLWLMKCSWKRNFLINNNYIFFSGQACDGNYPILIKINPGETKTYTGTLEKSIKFDYPCQHCIYGRQVETTRLGLIVIDDIYNSTLSGPDYDLAMGDKSRWKIIWSNALNLFNI